MRAVFSSIFAGVLLGLGMAPSPSQAVNFPVTINHDYCWGAIAACPHVRGTGINDFVMEQNREYNTSEGEHGTWVVDRAAGVVELTYDNGTFYEGQHDGGGCFSGTMVATNGSGGTWAGCRQ